MPEIIIKTIKDFQWGQIDTLEDQSLPRGAASRALNWITMGDHIELRRGSAILGDEKTGSGKVNNSFTAEGFNGDEISYRKRGQKLEYLNSSDVWTEVGSDVFGEAAEDEKASFAQHNNLSGKQLWINSPNSAVFIKIMLANPGTYLDMSHTTNYKGRIRIKQNRIFLWGYKASPTTIYLSKIDDIVDSHTDVASENIGTGNATTKTFTDTLAFVAARRNCFAIVATDGTETFVDNRDGTLTGSLGGTGTINYMTGAISVTFNTAPAGAQAITCNYSWEDASSGGIADFSFSAIRVAGEGAFFPQNDGGDIMNVYSYGDSEYCIHKNKTWVLTLTQDDTAATNLIYREKVGIPSMDAAVATGDGIYYIDTSDEKDYQIKILTLNIFGLVVPKSISKQLTYQKKPIGVNLSNYLFDKAVGIEWGDFILFSFRDSTSTENNITIMYDKLAKTIDFLDYIVSDFAIYGGTLLGADPIGKNVFTLFSGFDDDESNISNYWEGNNDNLDWDGLKKVKKKIIQGLIGPDQTIRVYASIDNGDYVTIGDIAGSGSYVDVGQKVNVGNLTIGEKPVGGGSSGISAYPYERMLDFGQDKFDSVKIKFEALGLGFASVSMHNFFDVRVKSRKRPVKYR